MKYHISESEYRFMEILWECEPIQSMDLVRICRERLDWKKPTTFTVIRKLGEKQVLCNENTIVRSLVSKDQIQRQESNDFLNQKFGGSLPSFINAYLQDKKLTKEDAQRIQKLIQDASEE